MKKYLTILAVLATLAASAATVATVFQVWGAKESLTAATLTEFAPAAHTLVIVNHGAADIYYMVNGSTNDFVAKVTNGLAATLVAGDSVRIENVRIDSYWRKSSGSTTNAVNSTAY